MITPWTHNFGRNKTCSNSAVSDMALFYLNLYNDIVAIDDDGNDYPDLAAAKAVAIAGARELMASHVQAGRPVNLDHRVEITDVDRTVLVVIPFGELITIIGRGADAD